MSKLKILDLFSGAGGLTEGFRSKNFDFICYIEMDKDACYSLKTREAFYYLNHTNQLEVYNAYLTGELSREELYAYVPKEILDKIENLEINSKNLEKIFQIIDSKSANKKIDGTIGGPPCQAYSTIGRVQNKSKKESDDRIYTSNIDYKCFHYCSSTCFFS
ncbi:DNA cytosine methyltransferase [Enterococcus lactis]|uniref:DNA cytosine methyltransferase n=1 Tax=Enterococcus lactis TaxID=357441 RepID=UPI002DBADFDA|nr:DNA cytosine methyltransferase [Enterococcus lactis]MEB7410739.1 DNA cytosine methyltransferase [Enterococcus lactis]